MNELTHLAEQEKIETLKEKIPAIGKLQDETIRLMKLVKKGKYQDSDMLDIHSLITLAKEQVERLKENEEIEALEETIPEIGRLQDETKRLMKLITKGGSQASNRLDIKSLIKIAKEKVEQLTNDEKELKSYK